MSNNLVKTPVKGGGFLLEKGNPEDVFTPEDYSEEIMMLRSATQEFLNKEVEPNKWILDSREGVLLAPKLLEKAAELGMLGLHVPEEYGGFGGNFKLDLAQTEVMADSFSFSQTIGVQKGLGIYGILFYGSKAQREKYLPKILSAEIKCSYCLTEPGAGSDASSGKTKASYSEDGKHFILNGQKMWITNSGFADVFTVFCKIEDDENLSCLIVEKEWGVRLGAEEKKLGIHGSSTRQVFFEDVRVPIDNLLGERNKGFKIAMNALNVGRINIGVAGSAIAKRAFRMAVQYANHRVQFKKPIASFGAIKEKVAQMASRMYALESTWNRLGGQIDNLTEVFAKEGESMLKAKQRAVADFAMECAIVKVYGSEVEQFVVDEALQIHGGMGYSGENDISVLYRNIRGNRIYEGTNEINRLLIPTTLLRKAMKGEIPLMEVTLAALERMKSGNLEGSVVGDEVDLGFLENLKEAFIQVSGIAMQKYLDKIGEEQEVLTRLADMLTEIYVLESTTLRVLKQKLEPGHEMRKDTLLLLMHDAQNQIRVCVKEILSATLDAEEIGINLASVSRLLQLPFINLKEVRRRVADHYSAKGKF